MMTLTVLSHVMAMKKVTNIEDHAIGTEHLEDQEVQVEHLEEMEVEMEVTQTHQRMVVTWTQKMMMRIGGEVKGEEQDLEATQEWQDQWDLLDHQDLSAHPDLQARRDPLEPLRRCREDQD